MAFTGGHVGADGALQLGGCASRYWIHVILGLVIFLDFVDAGMPSTVVSEDEFRVAMNYMVSRIRTRRRRTRRRSWCLAAGTL